MKFCNCLRCGRIFNHMSGPILCKECDEKIFDNIKEYILNNPSSTAKQISENTNISIRIIREYIKDQRLIEIRKNFNVCILCGEVIDDGLKYCSACKRKVDIANELNSMCNETKKDNPKMRFLTNNRYKR